MLKKILLVTTLLFATTVSAYAAQLTARLEPEVTYGSFKYILEYTADKPTSSSPDLTAVTDGYRVVERRQGTRTSTTNGVTNIVQFWQLEMYQNEFKPGIYILPSASLEGLNSNPVTLTVKSHFQP